ncbi:MAG: Chaperone protein DnaK [Candidatus Giovannonibacteria bacterium GW2011_GWA2_53_7]|uniref:Chaperone protein DnaK n=1 Tax=Candidatus Giovannonibacteria bacterium GW2011_GWA2_53_7 TaxID=1618650 RepID=A0A0G1XVK8_9BACT|nr:MAG: Chaperone protein DnaK [Candidatus Giovannonibacteria bacterium GW2011_GWA2_53_7]
MTFDIDANGILSVKATDKATGKEQSITITASSGLSKEEVEKMKQDAAMHAEEDKKKRGLIDARNNADSVIFQTEKLLKESGDKVAEEVKKEVTEKMEALKKVKDGEDAEAINKALEEMNQTVQKIGQAMYQQQAQANQPTAGQSAEDKEQPVEGEVEEVKEEKK